MIKIQTLTTPPHQESLLRLEVDGLGGAVPSAVIVQVSSGNCLNLESSAPIIGADLDSLPHRRQAVAVSRAVLALDRAVGEPHARLSDLAGHPAFLQ